MLYDDPIHKFVPLMWSRIHPKLLKEANKAAARHAVELKQDEEGLWCWRRLIDLPEMELGL